VFPSKGIAALFIASFFFGSAAILVRFATQTSALSLAFFRLLIAAAAVIMLGSATENLRGVGRRELALAGVSGAFLSLHFIAFIFAVRETTVANATFLVNTSPVMLAVMSPVFIKERTTSREGVSIVVAIFGVLLVANAGNGFGSFGLGEVSALLAAFLISVYSVIGRSLRTRGLNTTCYTAYAYSFGTLVAFLVVAGAGATVYQPYNIENILAILGLGLFPTAIGHTLYNYSLGSVKTVTANIVPLLEPIIASGLAVPLFNEVPTLVEVCGYALILVAVVIVVSGIRSSEALFV